MRIRMLVVQLVVGAVILSFLTNLSAPDAYNFLQQQISSALWRSILVLGLMVAAICIYSLIEVREKKIRKKHVFVVGPCRVQKIQTRAKRRMTKKNASDCNGSTPSERSAATCLTEGLHPQGPVGTLHEEADTVPLHPNGNVTTGRAERDAEGLLHPVNPVHRNRTADTARGEEREGLHAEASVGPVHEDADNEDFHPNNTPGQGDCDKEGSHPVGTIHKGADTQALDPTGKASSGRGESDTNGLHSIYPLHRNRTAATARGEDTEGSHREGPIDTVHKEADKEALHSNCTARRALYTEHLHPEITVVIEPHKATEHLRRDETVATVLDEEPESSHHGNLRSSPAADLETAASTLAKEVCGQYSIERGWQDSVSESLPSPHPARQISPPRRWRFMGIFRFLQRRRTPAPLAPSVVLATVDFMATTISTNQPVPGVEAASKSDLTLNSSKVVYKWLDIGPQIASDQLDRLKLQIIKSISEARKIDEDSSLQIGSFAVLKYTGTGPKWWRLQGHSIPTILSVRRHPWTLLDLLYGRHAKWSIRGFNLQDSQLKVSTVDEKEDLNIRHHEKMVSGEEVLLCEESHLVRKFALWFQKDVYIFATKPVEVEKGVKVSVQSKPSDQVKRVYWISVVQGLVPNVLAIIIMASFSLANTFNVGFNLEGTWLSTLVLGKLYSFVLCVFSYFILVFVLTLWRLTHKELRPAGPGDNVPSIKPCKGKRLLFPLFKVFKRRSAPLIEPLIEQCTHSEFTRPDDPLRNDPDVLQIRNMLHSCRDEILHHSLVQIAQRVHTKEQVPEVEAALQSDYTTYWSRVLHRRIEIGPQTGNLELDDLSLQIAKAMRRARQIDENCTLQFGRFALLKYKDGELKWWRLQEHWTPIIDEISRSPFNILDFLRGRRTLWTIRGSNLENATLEASTANEKEAITILSIHKLDSGEDVLRCAEPGLIWRSALLFWKGVYICALNSINDTKEGLDFDLQSESKNVTKVCWTSVAEGLRCSPRTLMFTIANLLSLGICFSLGYIPQGMIVSLILSYWWLAAKPGPSIGVDISSPRTAPRFEGMSKTYNRMLQLPDQDQAEVIKMDLDIEEEHQKEITTALAGTKDNFSITVESSPAMVEHESNGKRKTVGQTGDDVPGPPRTIPTESSCKNSCPRSPLLDEEIMNIEEKEEATEETEKVTVGEEEQWLAEHKQEEGDSMPSLQMCVPFEDLSNPANATSLLPEEDKSMNTKLNDEKQKEEGEALLRTLPKHEDCFNLRTSPPPVPDNKLIEHTENSWESDESVSGVAVIIPVAEYEDNLNSVRETPPTVVQNVLHGHPDSNVPPRQIYTINNKISFSTGTNAQQKQQVLNTHQHSSSPAGPSQQPTVTILGEEKALAGLLKLLSNDDNPDLQKHAASALRNLASETKLAQLKIVNEPEALAGLVKLLSKEDNPDLQEYAAAAFENLASETELAQLKIVNEPGALAGLVKLLSKDDNPDLQKYAASALRNLAFEKELAQLKIVNEPGALAGLVKLLSKDNNPNLQKYAASALWNLAFETELAQLKIVNEPGALPGLVKLLFKDDNPNLQEYGAAALWNLAFEKELAQLRIVNEPGALAGLVKLLSKEDNPDLQEYAAAAVQNLASKTESAQLKIVNEPGALAGLVKLLSKDNNPNLQKYGAGALQNLACEKELAQRKIVNEPRALSSLVKLLSKDHNPDLQKYAAAALRNLASEAELAQLKIVNEPGALAGLVKFLSKDDNPDLQEYAAAALENLASEKESAQLKIVNEPGALSGLVKLLSKDDNPDLQECAAAALRNLAFEKELARVRIGNEPRALAGLVKLLFKNDNPNLQKFGAGALQNLACEKELTQVKIVNEPGALSGLVKLLSKDNNPDLQEYAAAALQNLAFEKELAQLEIVNEPGALAGLVELLSKDDNPDLQEYAAAALRNLASETELAQLKIVNEQGALAGLVKLLSKDDNPDLQKYAAAALQNLASETELAPVKIVNEPGALAGLVKLLSKDDNPNLQEYAVGALQNLQSEERLTKLKIVNDPGVLVGLVKLLSNDHKREVQKYAVVALQNLIPKEAFRKLKNVNESEAVAVLVELLDKKLRYKDIPELQKVAAAALRNLANGPPLSRQKVLGGKGVLAGLRKLLSKKDNPHLQNLEEDNLPSPQIGVPFEGLDNPLSPSSSLPPEDSLIKMDVNTEEELREEA